MSAALAIVTDHLSPDQGHDALTSAFANLERSRHAVADAVWSAYESEAWLHDNGQHEHRYRMLMAEKQLRSIFEAYVLDEFDVERRDLNRKKQLGQLRQCAQGAHSVTERASAKALDPIAQAGVLNTSEPEQIVEALTIAADLADGRRTSLDPTPAIKPAEIRKGMERAGIAPPPKPEPSPEDAAELAAAKRKADREAATGRVDRDTRWLARNNYSASVRDVALLAIDLLGDKPKMLDEIRQALS